MKHWICGLLSWVVLACVATALEVKLDQTDDNRQRCAGMYSRTSWGGPIDPFILVKFTDTGKTEGEDPVVSLVVFEWKDEDLIGVWPSGDALQKAGICEPRYVEAGFCNDTDIGEYILAANATEESQSIILTKAVHLNDASPLNYPIKKTGYYCVLTDKFTASEYEVLVEFRNAYGELPATQIPKLPFYGGVTVLYALVLAFWGFLYFQHRADILAVQNYITAILIFLVVEMLMTWGFYDYMNRNGSNLGAKVLLGVVAILNAARNSFSFFLLLIVCMGYGVVKPTLGKTMIYVRWLAIAHFVFGLVYAITSLVISPDTAGPAILLIVMPLAGTLTAFYVWTLNSLTFTLKDLRERKQRAKESMYKKLWWCILLSIFIIFGFFFFNSFTFASASDPDYVPYHWESRWFILDGWLNLVYFADVSFIAYLWRPTANNRRFAMSDEIAQDDDGTFEIGDIGVPDDSDDEEAGVVGKSDGAGSGVPNGQSTSGAAAHDVPPPTGPPPSQLRTQPPPPLPRHVVPRDSLDGDTIFAVGEDDGKFSDDEADEAESSNLVKGRR